MPLILGGKQGTTQVAQSTASTSTPTQTLNTYATIAEMDVTISNLTIGSIIVARFKGDFYHATPGTQAYFGLSVDGAAEIEESFPNTPASNAIFQVYLETVFVATATSHNVKARWKTGAATLNGFGTARKLRVFEFRT